MRDRLRDLRARGVKFHSLSAGVKAAQRPVVRFGRKPKLTQQQIAHARKLIDKSEARQYIADLLNVGRSTLYRAPNA
jgi:DNA invertase Pin-like site-specific DNA recombinase